jgi:hypothetical protein
MKPLLGVLSLVLLLRLPKVPVSRVLSGWGNKWEVCPLAFYPTHDATRRRGGGRAQTKETLTSRPASFGSKAELSDELIKKVFKSNITESVLSFAAFKQSKELKKNDGAKRSRLTVRTPSTVRLSTRLHLC